MVHHSRDVDRRELHREERRGVAQNREETGKRRGARAVLRRAQQPRERRRQQKAHRHPVGDEPHAPAQQRVGKLVRALGVLQKREDRPRLPDELRLQIALGQHRLRFERLKPVHHRLHERFRRGAFYIKYGDARLALRAERGLANAQLRRRESAADDAGVHAQRLHERVARALDALFRLRLRDRAADGGLDLEAERHARGLKDQRGKARREEGRDFFGLGFAHERAGVDRAVEDALLACARACHVSEALRIGERAQKVLGHGLGVHRAVDPADRGGDPGPQTRMDPAVLKIRGGGKQLFDHLGGHAAVICPGARGGFHFIMHIDIMSNTNHNI